NTYGRRLDRLHGGRTFGHAHRNRLDPRHGHDAFRDLGGQRLEQLFRFAFDDVARGRSNLRVVDRVGEPVGASRVAEIGLDLYVHLELLRLVALGVADAVAPVKGHAAQLDAIHVPNCLEID